MTALVIAHKLSGVTEDMGALIKKRREALGYSILKLANEAGVDRGRLSALESGDPTVQPRTIGAVESALARLEHEYGMDLPSTVAEEWVEFRVSGNFGVDVVVRGPVRNMGALEEQVAKLIREMKRSPDLPDDEDANR